MGYGARGTIVIYKTDDERSTADIEYPLSEKPITTHAPRYATAASTPLPIARAFVQIAQLPKVTEYKPLESPIAPLP